MAAARPKSAAWPRLPSTCLAVARIPDLPPLAAPPGQRFAPLSARARARRTGRLGSAGSTPTLALPPQEMETLAAMGPPMRIFERLAPVRTRSPNGEPKLRRMCDKSASSKNRPAAQPCMLSARSRGTCAPSLPLPGASLAILPDRAWNAPLSRSWPAQFPDLAAAARSAHDDITECARTEAYVLPELFGPTRIVSGLSAILPLAIGPKSEMSSSMSELPCPLPPAALRAIAGGGCGGAYMYFTGCPAAGAA